jgi:hypothetical protein
MTDQTREPEDLGSLYRRAFKDYGSRALWNMRPVEDPTPAAALAITRALRTHGGTGGAWRSRLRDCAVPITKLQSHVLRVLAAGRSPDSYIAGASDADASALTDAGLKLSWSKIQSGRRQAEVESCGETMQLEWVADSAFRFFPAQPDELFGYVLHAVDLATNKASAAADRREPRDIVDLVTIHESVLPLGAVVCAAVGRFPGQSPEEMLSDIRRHSRFIYSRGIWRPGDGSAFGCVRVPPAYPEHDRGRGAIHQPGSQRRCRLRLS